MAVTIDSLLVALDVGSAGESRMDEVDYRQVGDFVYVQLVSCVLLLKCNYFIIFSLTFVSAFYVS